MMRGSVSAARGSIPAWAGETGINRSTRKVATVYPRVGGGNPDGKRICRVPRGLSPRGRGKPK